MYMCYDYTYIHVCVYICVKGLKYLSVFKYFLCRNEAVVWECSASVPGESACGHEWARRRAAKTMQTVKSCSKYIYTEPRKCQTRHKNGTPRRVSRLHSPTPVVWLTCTLLASCCQFQMNVIGVECGKSHGPTSSTWFDTKGSRFLPPLSSSSCCGWTEVIEPEVYSVKELVPGFRNGLFF